MPFGGPDLRRLQLLPQPVTQLEGVVEAVLRGQMDPGIACYPILIAPPTLEDHHTQEELRRCSLYGGFAQPSHRLSIVLLDAPPKHVEPTQHELDIRILFRRDE